MMFVSIGNQNENGNCSFNETSVLPLKWKPRNVSAVRDFPPGCGPIVRPITVVEPHKIELQNGDAQKVSNEEVSNPVITTIQVDDANMMPSSTHRIENGGSVITEAIPKKKFPQRRVSAVRDFPPYCGLNASEPTAEERLRINGKRICETEDKGGGRNVNLTESNGGVKDDSFKKTQSDDTSNESKTIVAAEESNIGVEFEPDITPKKVHNIGQACQQVVVYTRGKFPIKKCSDDEDSEDEKFEDETREMVLMPENKPLALIQKDIKNNNSQKVAHKKIVKKRPLDNTDRPIIIGEPIKVVLGLRAASLCAPETVKKELIIKPKVSHKKNNPEKQETVVREKLKMSKKAAAYSGTLEMVVREEQEREEENLVAETEEQIDEKVDVNPQGAREVDVTLLPFGPKKSNDARNKVRETLRFYQALCRKILQGEEAKANESRSGQPIKRVDLAAKSVMDEAGRSPVLGKKTYGPVPGVEVGDEFMYRVELALVGIHRPFQGGIDFVKQGKNFFAVSVVASGGYDNEVNNPDCLMYSGAGGVAKDKTIENQKLEKGNLALKNNIELKYPVRVVRGYKVNVKAAEESKSNSKSKLSTTYIYDGLYTVDSCKQVTGPKGNIVFRFELNRIPGQPQLALREVKSKKFKTREGVCVKDITNGKEKFPICAVNTIDNEKPPEFTYITKIVYPDWYRPVPPNGCDCTGRCSSKKCACGLKNGGEIPYNHNGAIVEVKPLVYECGPSCKCSSTCYNRVTQNGMKIPLEIFKTESRGWGVRSVSSISSGSFICEYIGELLEDTEAEKRTGCDEYLFDIGQNYNDCSVNPDVKSGEIDGTGGFTIDAAYYGNVGRFINHSCSPNLYAQNVLYDQEDKRMPHIMLFAAENISPLQELTYHYNYAVDTVHDSDGNIKIKRCYCGSAECTGRLY